MSLGLKLYISLFLVMVACLGIYTAVNITEQKKDLLDLVHQNALSTTDLIKNSIHYSMLINRKEDINRIFRNFANQHEFEAIRIYDKEGRIIFTTDEKEIGKSVTIDFEACQVCHGQATPRKAIASEDRLRIVTDTSGQEALALVNPIENEASCAKTGCHVSPSERAVLGVLDVQMSLEDVNANLARNQKNAALGASILVVVVLLVVAVLIWSQIRGPVRKLTEATKAIAVGDLDHHIRIKRMDEIGQLAKSFNQMVDELKEARNEITDWSNTLQEKVEQKTDELKKIQAHLLHVEKMASLGKLSATVAHELNNPLAGILNYARLTGKRITDGKLDKDSAGRMIKDMDTVAQEAIRCGNIVKNLLLFSRREVKKRDLHNVADCIEHCLHLIQHHLELKHIELKKSFPEDDLVTVCDIEQLRQAILALMINAIEAMPEGGTLSASVEADEKWIKIKLSDTGCGIEKDQLAKIFEPFYSSKTDGTGVGLGLSVAYGIIEAHRGKIWVESEIGKGSTFTVQIPRLNEIRDEYTGLPEYNRPAY